VLEAPKKLKNFESRVFGFFWGPFYFYCTMILRYFMIFLKMLKFAQKSTILKWSAPIKLDCIRGALKKIYFQKLRHWLNLPYPPSPSLGSVQRPARPQILNDTDSNSCLGSGDLTVPIPIPVLILEIHQFRYRFQSRFWRSTGSDTESLSWTLKSLIL
jgi:hypothetical protein